MKYFSSRRTEEPVTVAGLRRAPAPEPGATWERATLYGQPVWTPRRQWPCWLKPRAQTNSGRHRIQFLGMKTEPTEPLLPGGSLSDRRPKQNRKGPGPPQRPASAELSFRRGSALREGCPHGGRHKTEAIQSKMTFYRLKLILKLIILY